MRAASARLSEPLAGLVCLVGERSGAPAALRLALEGGARGARLLPLDQGLQQRDLALDAVRVLVDSGPELVDDDVAMVGGAQDLAGLAHAARREDVVDRIADGESGSEIEPGDDLPADDGDDRDDQENVNELLVHGA
jgi:hypothetical protein